MSCWTQALAKTDLDVLGAKPAETLDKSVKVVNTYHEIHCHGQCMLKAHVKNGRLLALTSAGDVPRCEAAKTDESIGKMQRRACMKGYAERKRLYAPDRLKYPLLQTIERGNLAGFKRISWDEAIDRACENIEKARARQKELGYIPIWEVGSTPLAFRTFRAGAITRPATKWMRSLTHSVRASTGIRQLTCSIPSSSSFGVPTRKQRRRICLSS